MEIQVADSPVVIYLEKVARAYEIEEGMGCKNKKSQKCCQIRDSEQGGPRDDPGTHLDTRTAQAIFKPVFP